MLPTSGVCGITINSEWHEPRDPSSPIDQQASEFNMQVLIYSLHQSIGTCITHNVLYEFQAKLVSLMLAIGMSPVTNLV